MIIRSKLIPTIVVVSFFGLIAVAIVSQRTLVGASLTAHAAVVVPGPSQFYAQHNIVSDIPGLADHTDSNVVNAWGLDAGDTTHGGLPITVAAKQRSSTSVPEPPRSLRFPERVGLKGILLASSLTAVPDLWLTMESARVRHGLSFLARTGQSQHSGETLL